jgi:YggT family protein
VTLIINAIQFVLFLFTLCLLGRIVIGLVMAYAHDWRPTGAMLVLTEAVFTVTDPPLKAIRRVVPPLTLGQVRLDLAMLILFFGIFLLRIVLAAIPTS